MTPQELAVSVKETLIDAKQKRLFFGSFTKKLDVDNTISLIGYLIKYGNISFESLENLGTIINESKEILKSNEIEKCEKELKALEEKLKSLKS